MVRQTLQVVPSLMEKVKLVTTAPSKDPVQQEDGEETEVAGEFVDGFPTVMVQRVEEGSVRKVDT
jgi:hypothetical protein